MRNRLLTSIFAIAAALTLSACSSFHLGAACYVPWGATGNCQVTTQGTEAVTK